MPWEYRLFYTVSDNKAFTLLDSNNTNKIEVREDIYILHDNTSLGIKFRGGGKFEIKHKVETDGKGGEKWKKVVKHKMELKETTIENLKKIATTLLANDHHQDVKNCLQTMKDKSDHILIKVSKSRQPVKFNNTTVEQADMTFELLDNKTDKIVPVKFRSLCIEDKKNAAETFQELCNKLIDNKQGFVIAGYPEFLHTWHTKHYKTT
jgi:hypothetical protein